MKYSEVYFLIEVLSFISILFPYISTFVFLAQDNFDNTKWKIKIGLLRMFIVSFDVLICFTIVLLPLTLFNLHSGLAISFFSFIVYAIYKFSAAFSFIENSNAFGLYWSVEDYIDDTENSFKKIDSLQTHYNNYLKNPIKL